VTFRAALDEFTFEGKLAGSYSDLFAGKAPLKFKIPPAYVSVPRTLRPESPPTTESSGLVTNLTVDFGPVLCIQDTSRVAESLPNLELCLRLGLPESPPEIADP
jgi:hypothetical protein